MIYKLMNPYLQFMKPHQHMAALGHVYPGAHGMTNFAFLPTLCELDCNWRSYLRDSGTSASPRKWLASIGALCLALVAHSISI